MCAAASVCPTSPPNLQIAHYVIGTEYWGIVQTLEVALLDGHHEPSMIFSGYLVVSSELIGQGKLLLVTDRGWPARLLMLLLRPCVH